jgi:5-bromo-4-chloroindolyl phosphate hydrolysis protein
VGFSTLKIEFAHYILKMRPKSQIGFVLKLIFYIALAIANGAIKTILPIVKFGFHFSLGLLSLIPSILLAKKNTNNNETKRQQLETFFMSRKYENQDPRHRLARQRFEDEIRAIKVIEREKKRKHGRRDGAWRLISVGAGLLIGGVVFQALDNFFAGVGAGLLIGGAIGWVGVVINGAITKSQEGQNVQIVPQREAIQAPKLNETAPNSRSELVQKVLLEAATALQKLDDIISKLRTQDSIDAVSQLVRTGKRLMTQIADNPEKLSIAQRVFTYYAPEAVGVADALAKMENEAKPDISRILSTQSVLQKLVILFEKTEMELKSDDNKSLDIDLKLLDQSLQADLRN